LSGSKVSTAHERLQLTAMLLQNASQISAKRHSFERFDCGALPSQILRHARLGILAQLTTINL
jgi:hypothetical protein